MEVGLQEDNRSKCPGAGEGAKLIVGEESKETGKMVRRQMTEV